MNIFQLKSSLYFFTTFTYFIYHKPIADASMEELDNYDQDIVDDEIPTNNNAINHIRSIFYQSREVKLIHVWSNSLPDDYGFQRGQQNFLECYHSNCYVTFGTHRDNIVDVAKYDVIAFLAYEIKNAIHASWLPKERSEKQKYVFVSLEPSELFPMQSQKLNNFFNWTWTYKLNSDLMWIPFVVENAQKAIVAPKVNVHWMEPNDMFPISKGLRRILRAKSRGVVWFSSECNDPNRKIVENLKNILDVTHNLELDIYGEQGCSDLQCGSENCYEFTRNYYFYLAFESACSDDYVTEVLLPALEYNTVPIVFGCANYSRFLPDGSYINAKATDLKDLAALINSIIHNFEEYVQYFRWTNHYAYHRTSTNPHTDIFCRMCALVHSDKMQKFSVYKYFLKWWNPKNTLIKKEITTTPTSIVPESSRTKAATSKIYYKYETTTVQPKKHWFRRILDSPFWLILYSFY